MLQPHNTAADYKRTHSLISSNNSQITLNDDKDESQKVATKPTNKKGRIEEVDKNDKNITNPTQNNANKKVTDKMDKKLLPLRNYLDQADTLINYMQFKSLMENTKGNKYPIELVRQYTNDLVAFKKFIDEDIYPNVRDRSIKLRCTHLLKKLNNPTQEITPYQTPVTSDTEETF